MRSRRWNVEKFTLHRPRTKDRADRFNKVAEAREQSSSLDDEYRKHLSSRWTHIFSPIVNYSEPGLTFSFFFFSLYEAQELVFRARISTPDSPSFSRGTSFVLFNEFSRHVALRLSSKQKQPSCRVGFQSSQVTSVTCGLTSTLEYMWTALFHAGKSFAKSGERTSVRFVIRRYYAPWLELFANSWQ